LGISYKTALRIVRKIHEAIDGKCEMIELGDMIEFDELYLNCGRKGEKDLDREPRKRGLKLKGRGTIDKDKPPIIGACDRKGNIRLKVSDNANSLTILFFLLSIISFFPNILKVFTGVLKVFTDDFTAYQFLSKIGIHHESVNHSAGEYARGEVHNNTMEGYWSVFRHWMNTYRGVSKNHLHEYVSFFEFVENNKKHGWFETFNRMIFLIWMKICQKMTYLAKNLKFYLNFKDQTNITMVSLT
jgi:transposase-like protein